MSTWAIYTSLVAGCLLAGLTVSVALAAAVAHVFDRLDRC